MLPEQAFEGQEARAAARRGPAQALPEVVAHLRTHREGDEPLDAIAGGAVPPDAGVEGQGWEEATLELVRSGPLG